MLVLNHPAVFKGVQGESELIFSPEAKRTFAFLCNLPSKLLAHLLSGRIIGHKPSLLPLLLLQQAFQARLERFDADNGLCFPAFCVFDANLDRLQSLPSPNDLI